MNLFLFKKLEFSAVLNEKFSSSFFTKNLFLVFSSMFLFLRLVGIIFPIKNNFFADVIKSLLNFFFFGIF